VRCGVAAYGGQEKGNERYAEAMAAVTDPYIPERAGLVRRGRALEFLTLAVCSLEAVFSIGAGFAAGSIALMGFGIDSVIELASGTVIVWRLHHDADVTRRQAAEATSLRIIGWLFLALAAYVAWESLRSLVRHEAPRRSILGICIAVLSLVAMTFLARAKRQVARGVSSHAMSADARQTELCSLLSAILLGGLLLNAFLGWWWADPAAGLLMTPIIAKEGFEALRGKSCGCAAG
jgi:divalent metal cation (Fe/Co/Zn/Cd) transporter